MLKIFDFTKKFSHQLTFLQRIHGTRKPKKNTHLGMVADTCTLNRRQTDIIWPLLPLWLNGGWCKNGWKKTFVANFNDIRGMGLIKGGKKCG